MFNNYIFTIFQIKFLIFQMCYREHTARRSTKQPRKITFTTSRNMMFEILCISNKMSNKTFATHKTLSIAKSFLLLLLLLPSRIFLDLSKRIYFFRRWSSFFVGVIVVGWLFFLCFSHRHSTSPLCLGCQTFGWSKLFLLLLLRTLKWERAMYNIHTYIDF